MVLIEQYEQYEKAANGVSWNKLFQHLNNAAYDAVDERKLTIKHAKLQVNEAKNRYIDVLPFDDNRIVLSKRGTDPNETDYINASYIRVDKAKRNFILTQGPLSNTIDDFWHMIWESDVHTIVMLNKLIEGGKMKCVKYYPSGTEFSMATTNYKIELMSETSTEYFTVRKLNLINLLKSQVSREVIHIQYSEWPDFGIPESTAHFLELLDYVRTNISGSEDKPVVVHCSAGIGRSGSYILVDSVLRMVELGLPESDVSVTDLLTSLRCQRFGIVQTWQQLKFSWNAVADRLKEKKNMNGGTRLSAGKESKPLMEEKAEKRKALSSDDERLAKRRQIVADMVARSRQVELSRHSSTRLGTKLLLLGGTLALAAAVGFYVYRR